MKFGEKLKMLRKKTGLSQRQLAEMIGTTSRSILNYEKGARLPQNIEIVNSIARALGVSASYLMSDDEEFIIKAGELYGESSADEARQVLDNAVALFAGGKLDDDEMLSFMTRIQSIYLDSKAKSKDKQNG